LLGVAAHDAREREERSKERRAMEIEAENWELQGFESGEGLT
jgi:hypothetical protein